MGIWDLEVQVSQLQLGSPNPDKPGDNSHFPFHLPSPFPCDYPVLGGVMSLSRLSEDTLDPLLSAPSAPSGGLDRAWGPKFIGFEGLGFRLFPTDSP